MNIPKTEKGLSNKISKIRAQFRRLKQEYGFINDGSGTRYYLFYLYFLLNDNKRSAEYIRWYEKEFPDDVGEPVQLLCWALMQHRIGKEAAIRLRVAMLSNIYLIPYLLGEPIERIDSWFGSDDETPEYLEYLPEQVRNAITDSDLEWIKEMYYSEEFQQALNRHKEIKQKLVFLPVGTERFALVNEDFQLRYARDLRST